MRPCGTASTACAGSSRCTALWCYRPRVLVARFVLSKSMLLPEQAAAEREQAASSRQAPLSAYAVSGTHVRARRCPVVTHTLSGTRIRYQPRRTL
eukprot:1335478-Rhodomonas_salina.1